jgi:membrane-associated protease RseP (regulator of RpoE activity)
VINANALDMSLFNFDYDLSFTTMFFNGDGTLYGRYGSWTHQKNAQDKTTSGFKRALEGALELHQGYPANKASLAGKQSPKASFKTPVDIPTLSGKYKIDLDWNGKVVPSCVHCHQIGDALRANVRKAGEPMPMELLYPWPAAESIGLTLAPDQRARIESVAPQSIAAKAGCKAGDDIVMLDGQPMLSSADVSWVLHRAPEKGTLSAVVRRDGAEQTVRLELLPNWRSKADISRRVGTWGLRGMAAGGLVLEDLPDEERSQRSLPATQLALLVKFVGEYGKHAAAKKAGFQKNDVIVELQDVSGRLSESELFGHLLTKTKPGDKVEATVLRGTERVKLVLPMQ